MGFDRDFFWFLVVLFQALGEEAQGREGSQQAQEASERVLRLHVSARIIRVFIVWISRRLLRVRSDRFVLFVLRREGFRKEYKEQHPNVKQVSVVSIAMIRFDLKFCAVFLRICVF